MSGYQGKSSIVMYGNYANQIYETKSDFGTSPPTPPIRFLLQENGQFLLQENGQKIELELGTPE